MKPLFQRAVIAGVGLIGGSLALAGKRAGLFGSVTGVSRNPATVDAAVKLGIIDEGFTDVEKAAAGADLFFAAVPVESIVPLCKSAAPYLEPGAVVTDGGSVKTRIVEQLDAALPSSVRFVGGHPIAGTEKSGPRAAFAELFEGRYTILAPTGKTDPGALAKVKTMWEGVGSTVVEMSPEEHDRALAVISHLPHLAAYALVDTLDRLDADGTIRRFIAGGFKDTTRIAMSDAAMWRDIFSMNKDQTLKALEEYEKALAALRGAIVEERFGELGDALEKIRRARLGMEEMEQ
ncbi:MAG: prephenate dehydrogenase [Candidatus Nitrospinota bacterium M3_3B_026]